MRRWKINGQGICAQAKYGLQLGGIMCEKKIRKMVQIEMSSQDKEHWSERVHGSEELYKRKKKAVLSIN